MKTISLNHIHSSFFHISQNPISLIVQTLPFQKPEIPCFIKTKILQFSSQKTVVQISEYFLLLLHLFNLYLFSPMYLR